MEHEVHTFSWVGSEERYLDHPATSTLDRMVIGRYGGNTAANANKNEDRGQYLLNQRNYYEWIGFVNTFAQPVACYSSGVRELRQGRNVIVMNTDGLLEVPRTLYLAFTSEEDLEECVDKVLTGVHKQFGRDSATVVAWSYDNGKEAAMPSD